MNLRLILARHGDTFNPGDRVVFVGARNDLPLTVRGRQQAEILGELLSRSGLQDSPIFCGPLQRTKVFAEIAAAHVTPELRVTIDPRLNELDYGHWAGLTNEEVRARYGDEELYRWSNQSIWPQNAGWPESETQITSEVLSLVDEIKSSGVTSAVVISSNGRLRYFLKSIPGAFERYADSGQLKVQTGNVCVIHFSTQKDELITWNAVPSNCSAI